ncbi:MAG: TRC40/GET3/ArsA family transport-energizing ATPase [Syntrophorhabdaceae bacterium]|nr:TRC40/GET3/ArsA family transport-energizing ATPase [Syntrophorhabdaceae bacterium]MDD5245317.1 TRC40/GET3/ArsA family transport-energizing ATPase [Syntrophorhabdaceae bacterium]
MDQITISMTKYMNDHPNLKYIFFGGKGGVGKTVMAGTAALWSAKQGKRTLLASTNPVHSLSNLFEKDVFGKAAVVCDDDRCFAFEIDTKDTIERSKQEIREKINWFLRFADLTTKADDFVESATMNPAFEESAMFENMTDIMFEDKYDFYVFDTAPTANARRLLGMSKVYSLWVEKMLKSREEAKSLREMLSFSKKNEADPLMDYLIGFKDRMAKAQSLLTNDQLTAFFFATLPESLPIAVITRFINWFYEFGIPVGGVVVNGIIQKDQVSKDASEFVLNRVKMQDEHMEEIWQIFGDRVRAVIPLFETEVKGNKMINRMVDHLFA